MNITKLNSTFIYNAGTGVLTRKTSIGGQKAGSVCGTRMKAGHLRVRFDGKKQLVHRLVWVLEHNSDIPKGLEIDHINHDSSDNRIANLRLVTSRENGMNKSKLSRNKSGATGVSLRASTNKWRARIKVDYKNINLGSFTEFHEAVNARKNAEVLYGFHKNHGT